MSRFLALEGERGTRKTPSRGPDLPLFARLVLMVILLLVLFPVNLELAFPALGLVGLVVLDLASVDLVGRAIRRSLGT